MGSTLIEPGSAAAAILNNHFTPYEKDQRESSGGEGSSIQVQLPAMVILQLPMYRINRPLLCNQLPNACPTKTGLESCSSRACAIHLQLHSDSLQKAGASLEGIIHSAAAKALGDSKRCQVGAWRIILAA